MDKELFLPLAFLGVVLLIIVIILVKVLATKIKNTYNRKKYKLSNEQIYGQDKATEKLIALQNSVDDSVQVERDRGVGSHGERPKIYPARLNKAQKDCLVNIAGASILSSFSKPWFILPGSVALAWYNSCSRL